MTVVTGRICPLSGLFVQVTQLRHGYDTVDLTVYSYDTVFVQVSPSCDSYDTSTCMGVVVRQLRHRQ